MSVFQLDGFYPKICYIHYTYMDTPWHTQYGCSNLDIACRKGMLEVVKYLCELSGTGEEMMMSTKKVSHVMYVCMYVCILCGYLSGEEMMMSTKKVSHVMYVCMYVCILCGYLSGEEMMMSTKKVRNCALRVTSCIICAYNMNGVGDDDDVNQQGEKLHILLSHVYMHTNDYMDGMR